MKDFLIVGLGFSGIAFSRELEKQNISYAVVDPGSDISATKISGGLIHPVTGRKYQLQWNFEECSEIIKQEYALLAGKFNTNFLSAHTVLKIHKSETALEEWQTVKNKEEIAGYLDADFSAQHLSRYIDYRFGYIAINPVYQVDTNKLLAVYTNYLKQENKLFSEKLNYNDIRIHDDYFEWKSNRFKYILFCDGAEALHNPFFNWIAFKPAKGEAFILKIPNFKTDLILQKNLIVLPLGDETYWAGATNTWNDLSMAPTAAGREELIAGLKDLLKIPFEIKQHYAAIRPTIKDRVPVVGAHPEIKNMFMLNGMGTKGASLSNYYARQLFAHIFSGKEINKEANINRFYKIAR